MKSKKKKKLFVNIFFHCSGCEKHFKPHLETIQDPNAVTVWRRRGKIHKGMLNTSYFERKVAISQMQLQTL